MQRNAIQFLHGTGGALIAHEADEPVGEGFASVRVSHDPYLVNFSKLTKDFL